MKPLVRTRPRPIRPADFAADEAHVAYRGLIFRAGDYKNKQFYMTPAELAAVARTFTPVPVDLGHPSASSPLDGTMGQLTEVELSGDGTALFGRIEIPKWLDQQLGPAARKVSSSWDRATKRMRRLSLVTHPAIPDAVLEAAFAAHECTCHQHHHQSAPEEVSKMTRKQAALAALSAMGDDDDDFDEAAVAAAAGMDYVAPDADDGAAGPPDFADRDVDRLRAENDELHARLERLEVEALEAKAAEFAAAQVAARRILPSERRRIEALHVRAAIDDRDNPVEFAGGRGTSRLAEFAATIEARKPHYLFDEAVPGGKAKLPTGYRVLDPSGRERGDAEFADDEVDEDTAYARRVNAKYLGKDRINGKGLGDRG